MCFNLEERIGTHIELEFPENPKVFTTMRSLLHDAEKYYSRGGKDIARSILEILKKEIEEFSITEIK